MVSTTESWTCMAAILGTSSIGSFRSGPTLTPVRISSLFVVVVVLAACGAASDDRDDPGLNRADSDAVGVLTYDYQPGQTLEYRVVLRQDLTATGTSSLTAEDEDNADVTTEAAGVIRYEITDGPEPGLVEIDISGDFDTVETTGTFNGRPIETPKDITPFAPEVEAPNDSVIVDESGLPWRDEDGPRGLNPLWLLNPRFAAFDPLESPLGPLFDGSDIAVGDTWTQTDQIYVTDQLVTTTYRFTVDSLADADVGMVAIISYTSETDGFTVDFGDTVQDLLAFLGRGTDADAGLTIVAAPAMAQGVVTFDLTAGNVVSQTATSTYSFDVDASIPLQQFAEADIVLAGEITYTADRIDTETG